MSNFNISNTVNLVKSLSFLILLSLTSCDKNTENIPSKNEVKKLFTTVSPKDSGIDFQNSLIETPDANYFLYNYIYIGGGVATADFNNDGLVDIFFSSNTSDNKLYLNKGDFKFEDISKKAGIIKRKGFDTGVTIVDVNNDGYLDIYLSRGGWIDENHQFANMLYINNGDLTFTEKAQELGLADENRTINAIFFDYDNDNDLDVYISNAGDIIDRSQTDVRDLLALQKDPKTIALKGSDQLYNNDGTGHFTNVSIKSGILPETGFGLNPQVADLNNDGWLDIYVNNDFNIPDYVYLNNGNGTFSEGRDKVMKHMAFNTMGGDVADINNDGLLDLMTLDMNPEDYIRSKTTMGMTSIENFESMTKSGYHYQYMHNMLQVNNGNGTFSEISKMAGIGDTDWSWSLLSADFDLDGHNDVFVTNGVFRDVIDRDSNSKILATLRAKGRKPTKEDFFEYVKMLPQQKLTNYFFKNNKDLTFKNTSKTWSSEKPTFSNGAAYADFDNDGDLDLVVNNINEPATLLKNNAREIENGSFIQFSINGPDKNKFGVGTIVNLYMNDGSVKTRQLINTRGFLSAVSNKLHFGIHKDAEVLKAKIVWQDGKQQEIINPTINTTILVTYSNATKFNSKKETESPTLFSKVKFEYAHDDPYFNDYHKQVLLPHKLSQTGPAVAKADINNDGFDDVFIGGGRKQAGKLLLSTANGSFKTANIPDFINDKNQEDVGATFFDADGDGDQDLYVVSGSYEFSSLPKMLLDRLYINNGNGKFSKSTTALPDMVSAGSIAIAKDFDNDGDQDLFVGGRVIPEKYPYAPRSYLLVNNNGKFSIATPNIAPDLEFIGMVTDAVWTDINNDHQVDLIVTGEWMGIEVFINKNGKLIKSNDYPTLKESKGWWNKVLVSDIDNDGDKDIIAGNLGTNYKFHASKEQPFHIYTNDFDFNGVEDVFLAKYYNNKEVPVRGKGCTAQQLPHLKNKIKSYNEFANSDLEGILGPRIKTALHYKVNQFKSGIFKNNGTGNFTFKPFSNHVQKSVINSIILDDINGDNIKDLILSGNNHMSEVETTRADAGTGVFLEGNKKGNYDYIPNKSSGLFADKDVRNMLILDTKKGKLLLIINNNETHDLYTISKLPKK
ncbi:VCBS repeat-containing protein [Polaribacter staleyi]|uniref:VCBS repeat-containing protein n=1 Tax=Polaribacter staleyi TaxID=2022337 RepID=UPI0031B9DEF0